MFVIQLQQVMLMYANKTGLTFIEIIFTYPQINIENVDGNHFGDVIIFATRLHRFQRGLESRVENALQIIKLPIVLDFDNDGFAVAVAYFQINAAKLVALIVLIVFAFQHMQNKNVFFEQFT